MEIRLSAPTKANPTAAVMERPTIRLKKTARMIRGERKASHRMVNTTRMVRVVLTNAPSLRVAYSSSAIATVPVSRTGAILRSEVQILRRLADGIARRLSGHQGGIVEHRPDIDEAPPLARIRGAAVEHRAPGEARRASRDDLVERIRDHVQGPGEVIERVVVHPRPDQPVVQGGGQAAQIGILRQGLNDGLGLPAASW